MGVARGVVRMERKREKGEGFGEGERGEGALDWVVVGGGGQDHGSQTTVSSWGEERS